MKANMKFFGGLLLVFGILILPNSTVFPQSQPTDSLLNNEVFTNSFIRQFNNYNNFPKEALVLDLSDLLEDLLISGSHASRTGLDYKINQMDKALYKKIRYELCGPNYRIQSSNDVLIYYLTRGLINFTRSEGLELTHAQYGTMAGTLFCIVNQTKPDDFCNGTSFLKLAQ